MPKRRTSDSNLPKFKRPLSEGEMVAFRQDIREADKEVQGYFRVYYVIGLIGVAAWIISPQVKPLVILVLGNGGYNIYAPMVIAFLNSVSMTYLLYKSVEIHEIAQFISYGGPPDSGFIGWETWRRSMASATRWPRVLYTPFLTFVPLAVSTSLLYASWRILRTPVDQLLTIASTLSLVPPQDPTSGPITAGQFTQSQIESIATVFSTARITLYIIIFLHVIPVALIYFNLFKVPRLWTIVRLNTVRDPARD
ncbi:MAG: hypothetical protein ACLGJB_08935 [Blastocatellia bacterium]